MAHFKKKSPATIYLLNLGCSKNQVDAERILGEFAAHGVRYVESPEEADLLLVNTCGFIESAKEESIQEILTLAQSKRSDQQLLVAGCLSQRYGNELRSEMPEVDLMVGTYHPGELVQKLALAPDPSRAGCISQRIRIDGMAHHAFIKVAEGCNRNCAFCAIPLIRGKQVSTPPEELIAEIQSLHTAGVKEISLVAQDLSYYGRERGGPQTTLHHLVEKIVRETEVDWIRLCYAYPALITPELIELMANEPRICKYLDIPIQHGSDAMLAKMHRGYTKRGALIMLRKLRKAMPEIALRTTLLIGFPGESESDIEELLEIVEEVRFDRLGCFTYSEEEGTAAARSKDPRVDPEIAIERAERIMAVQEAISGERNEKLIGRELKVIVDSADEGGTAHFVARTEWDAPEVDNIVRIVEGNATPGEFCRVRVVDATPFELDAVVV